MLGVMSPVFSLPGFLPQVLGHCPGYGASQQTAESANRKLKRDLKSAGAMRTHLSVMQRLEKVVRVWQRPLRLDELQMSPLMSLDGPLTPCAWMTGSAGRQENRPALQPYQGAFPHGWLPCSSSGSRKPWRRRMQRDC